MAHSTRFHTDCPTDLYLIHLTNFFELFINNFGSHLFYEAFPNTSWHETLYVLIAPNILGSAVITELEQCLLYSWRVERGSC